MPLLPRLVLCAALCACTSRSAPSTAPSTARPAPAGLDAAAEQYVKLVLAVGQHDANYVDAYFGPPAWAEAAREARAGLPELAARADALAAELDAMPAPAEPLLALRRRFLATQVRALGARVRLLSGERMTFDAESLALYGATAPVRTEAEFEAVLRRLDARLPPGPGGLAGRLDLYRRDFVVPRDRLEPVLQAAIAEARRRTLAHIPLPANETFILEFVRGKPWGGYNWFKGNATSVIEVNTDLPVFAWRVLGLAAHEGYPGHHVYNTLLEQHLVRERGWVELTTTPLYSPLALVAEGTANYGVDVAFPDAAAHLRDVLFPLAGLDPARAAEYVEIEELATELAYADNEAARRYLDGAATREQARDWLVRYGLLNPDYADKRITFIETYRAYVINYNLGRDMVAAYVERHGGTDADHERRWAVFRELLSAPRLPADLR